MKIRGTELIGIGATRDIPSHKHIETCTLLSADDFLFFPHSFFFYSRRLLPYEHVMCVLFAGVCVSACISPWLCLRLRKEISVPSFGIVVYSLALRRLASVKSFFLQECNNNKTVNDENGK